MATLRHIHQYMTERKGVTLDDGRTGKIVKVDTCFPERTTQVSVWIQSDPERNDDELRGVLVKVDISRVVGASTANAG